MKSQTCCFTGHRKIPEAQRAVIQKRLEMEILNLIRQDLRYFCAGGALGFDTMAALAVLKLKSEFPHVQLILVLPCKDQTKGWEDADIKTYNLILNQADKVVYVSEKYYNGCMMVRNRHLVNHSGICVCYLTDVVGGTAYTVGYAKQKGLQIMNLAMG